MPITRSHKRLLKSVRLQKGRNHAKVGKSYEKAGGTGNYWDASGTHDRTKWYSAKIKSRALSNQRKVKEYAVLLLS